MGMPISMTFQHVHKAPMHCKLAMAQWSTQMMQCEHVHGGYSRQTRVWADALTRISWVMVYASSPIAESSLWFNCVEFPLHGQLIGKQDIQPLVSSIGRHVWLYYPCPRPQCPADDAWIKIQDQFAMWPLCQPCIKSSRQGVWLERGRATQPAMACPGQWSAHADAGT